ncbi:MAG TPA: hypothetical protein VFQ65_16490 [Kofleriaceae bacterium]|nr:hypothetical protein [Kofleriaceae bacterium]
MRALLVMPFLAACANDVSSGDVVGPFTGATRRFAIDHYGLPVTNTAARMVGDDLNGDKAVDNQLGLVFSSLATQLDLAPSPMAMWSAGVLPTTLLVQADDFVDDPSVGVSYLGKPGDTAVPAGGTFVAGTFASNRTRTTTHGAQGTLVLPVFVDADPTAIVLDDGEIDLVPDGDGYTGELRGLVRADAALDAAAASIAQMVMTNPADHLAFAAQFDNNGDGEVTADEVKQAPLVKALLGSDIERDGESFLSLGIGIHLVPCDQGTCAPTAIADPCHDRVQDGDETDVDCGGSCHACSGGAGCALAADCQSATCSAGTCAAASCSDDVQDGFETSVDCGDRACGLCAGMGCNSCGDLDPFCTGGPIPCHSGVCNAAGVCE